jgi:hypothetical protein
MDGRFSVTQAVEGLAAVELAPCSLAAPALAAVALAPPQGIDLKAGGRNLRKHREAPKSDNVYLKLLVKVSSRDRQTRPLWRIRTRDPAQQPQQLVWQCCSPSAPSCKTDQAARKMRIAAVARQRKAGGMS